LIAPLLIHANLSKPFVLEMEASDFTIGIVLSQLGKHNLLRPIDFCSCKFFLAEINHEIHDKKLLAIVNVFKEWCHLREELNMKSLYI